MDINANITSPLAIGFTERGDGGLDTSWFEKRHKVDGIVIVTKNVTHACAERLLRCFRDGYPILLHAGRTGWGGTVIEPNVPTAELQLASVAKLVSCGFPRYQVTLRIDPVIPTPEGLERFRHVLRQARAYGLLPGMRVRVSVMDDYAHVKARFRAMGLEPVYPGRQFQASPEQFAAVARIMLDNPDITFETCAETAFDGVPNAIRRGCLSMADLEILDLADGYSDNRVNPQGRNGCLCLGAKTELLSNRRRCPHRCAYCYWKD